MDIPDAHLYDLPSWSFVDPFDDQAFRLHANANANTNTTTTTTSDEQLLSTMSVSPFGLSSWDQLDMHLAHELSDDRDALPNPAKSGYTYNYPDRAARFPAAKNMLTPEDLATVDLDDLLRSTSQLATERALYMTVGSPTAMSLPMLDACSSPGSSHLSSGASDADVDPDADWERDLVYRLPDPAASTAAAAAPFHPAPVFCPQALPQEAYATPECSGLTPLEMPDGSTRFTSNWLPVDPEGGFTIHTAATATTPFSPCPLEYPDSMPAAFISVGRRVDSTAG
ncbi:hypothetical protein ATEIFO6365_0004090800 [Aspergillus terreus]|uniref:Uncharacterized protein n=1 Tax=Aspergillus terreus TaxID=33178 RepID=A0A5M3YQN8_ASPTE|nr:hypothetical protein ATETN484_0002093300 [Aspergillus terreus]GFF15789.1 hypothetical protein ATEIFO6365_0004090800 [Aspergillus terreus]